MSEDLIYWHCTSNLCRNNQQWSWLEIIWFYFMSWIEYLNFFYSALEESWNIIYGILYTSALLFVLNPLYFVNTLNRDLISSYYILFLSLQQLTPMILLSNSLAYFNLHLSLPSLQFQKCYYFHPSCLMKCPAMKECSNYFLPFGLIRYIVLRLCSVSVQEVNWELRENFMLLKCSLSGDEAENFQVLLFQKIKIKSICYWLISLKMGFVRGKSS